MLITCIGLLETLGEKYGDRKVTDKSKCIQKPLIGVVPTKPQLMEPDVKVVPQQSKFVECVEFFILTLIQLYDFEF